MPSASDTPLPPSDGGSGSEGDDEERVAPDEG